MAPNNPMHEKPFDATFDEVLEAILPEVPEEAADNQDQPDDLDAQES